MSNAARATTSKASTKFVINSIQSMREVTGELLALWHGHKYLALSVRIGRDRSTEQNRLWRRMYLRIADVTKMGTDDDVWAYCKLHIGTPILRRDDAVFDADFGRIFEPLPYEKQLELMGNCNLFGPDGFPVTRLLSTKQGSEYTQNIADHFAMYSVPFDDILRDAA